MVGTIDSPSDRSLVAIVAAYDEAERIGATLRALGGAFPGIRPLVADDGSTDGTGEIALREGAQVVRCERVLGKGQAVTKAARRALEVETDPHALFLLCDGDLGDSAARLTPLVELVAGGDADVAVAAFARRVGGGFGVALRFARWAIRRRCGMVARAPISGQRVLTRAALEAVLPLAKGYGMEVGMTIDAVRAGLRVSEVELDLSHRATGRNLSGFAHRARQLVDFARAYAARG